MEERSEGEMKREESGYREELHILHSLQDYLQPVSRSTLHTASIGEPVKVNIFYMSPQVLIHTLVVCTLKLLSVHHHFEGICQKEEVNVHNYC